MKVTGIEYADQKKFMYVEGIPQKSLQKSVFVFSADKLVGIQLHYGDINWSEEQFKIFFTSVKANLNNKYGEGVSLSKHSKIIDNMVLAYDSNQWASKTTGFGLFLFSAAENN